MKILIISNSCLGTYMFRRELIGRFLENHSVTLAVPHELHYDDFEKMGCTMKTTALSRHGKNVFKELGLIGHYSKIIDEVKPDVVLTFTAKPNVYVPPICRRKKIPCIVNVAGLGTPCEKGGAQRSILIRAYLSSLKKATRVFFQNEEIFGLFSRLGLDSSKCKRLNGSGVNTDHFCRRDYPDKGGKMRFLFAGRIVEDKGIHELLRAAGEIKAKHPEAQFVVAGEFESESCRAAVEKAQSEKTVEFLGYVDDMRGVYGESWAAVVPSHHEGLSNVCLEAAATGRPVIASDISGCREAVEDGNTGILFEASNSEKLTEAIEKFISLPYDKKVKMGLLGREKVEKEFDRRAVTAAYEEEILDLLRKKRKNLSMF
ncbi:MAG: glycosyltransferase family 4 protein [Clostridia bacterium]|nr:glycosyltransferase family 4 protein [Clostridia bacterium]